jgi:hypothetical protein
VKNQECEDAVEAVVGHTESTGVPDLERDSWVGIVAGSMCDVDRREVDATQLPELTPANERLCEAASATADVENVFPRSRAGEVKKWLAEATTPPTHL